MVIDFHTHAFPDGLAERAKASLTKASGYVPVTDLTAGGLVRFMDEAGVDRSVVMPVVTKATQTERTNLWAASLAESSGGRLVPFGGIWPHSESLKSDIDFVVSLGLKGIKLHAEYQSFYVNDPEMLKLYDYAFSRGLMIMQHGGADPAYSPPYHSSPKMFAEASDAMRGGVMIVAHFGGHAMWDEVERDLVGKNVWLDTSMGFGYYSQEQFCRIVNAHGADRILFGTDSPWSDARAELAALAAAPLGEEQKELIRCGNALKLLGQA